jgi:hypothetical protein
MRPHALEDRFRGAIPLKGKSVEAGDLVDPPHVVSPPGKVEGAVVGGGGEGGVDRGGIVVVIILQIRAVFRDVKA